MPEIRSGVVLIAIERQRQVVEEGWTTEHDDRHTNESLVKAAVCYATSTSFGWPWHMEWWKPQSRIRDLVRAGALIAAEIDRLQRAGETL